MVGIAGDSSEDGFRVRHGLGMELVKHDSVDVEGYVMVESCKERDLVIIKVTLCLVSTLQCMVHGYLGNNWNFLNVDPNGTNHEYGSEAGRGIC